MIKDIFKIIIFTLLFSIILFFLNYAFFGETKTDLENKYIEQNYIEPSLGGDFNSMDEVFYRKDILEKYKKLSQIEQKAFIEKMREEIKKQNEAKRITQKKLENQKIITQQKIKTQKFDFEFFPENTKNYILKTIYDITKTLSNRDFDSKIDFLKVEFYSDRYDTRGKMKNGIIKLFDPADMGETESFAVFIHEFGHIIDLYFLKNIGGNDVSNIFYDISWKSTTVIKAKQTQNDFVSGYSMTNKYEDFAESFAFFVLHNDDFLEKTKSSDLLAQKYIFFKNYIFPNDKFISSDFSTKQNISYFWDTTKLNINIKNFLQYLEK